MGDVIDKGLEQMPSESLRRVLRARRMLLDGQIYDSAMGYG